MPASHPITTLRTLAASLLLLLPLITYAQAADPFEGDYVGTFHPIGEHGGRPRPEDGKDFKPQKCGTCHTEATIRRNGTGYSLTMLIDHGKDKEGQPKIERITLQGERRDKGLAIGNDVYSIAVADGEATGGRTGRMAAEIKLKRKAAPPTPPAGQPSKPRATVGAYYFDGWAGTSQRWKDDPAWVKLQPPTHLTKRMLEEFADREPVWGWRDDKLEIMER